MTDIGLSVEEIARRLGGRVVGDGSVRIERVANLELAGGGCISFVADTRFRKQLAATSADAVLVGEELADVPDCTAIVVTNPYAAYARVTAWLQAPRPIAPGVHASALVDSAARIDALAEIGPMVVVEAGARIGPQCQIGPGCVIGRDARIGAGTRLAARVVVGEACELGDGVRVQAGAIIGSEGFGYARDGQDWIPIVHQGRVRIGRRVEIGANTTIDRGSLEDTVIEDGAILDNLIQVAHNVRIGARTAIAGCVGIAGSARIGSDCTIGGAATILGHLEITDNVHITAMSMVTRSISKPGRYSSGMPLEANSDWRRNAVRIRHLDKIARRLEAIEKTIKHQS